MEENSVSLSPTFKLYKNRAIYIGTFLGGPLVAGYLIAENFKQLGQTDKAKTTWVIAICATIGIFSGIFLLPICERIPNFLIPLIYTLIVQYLVQKFQSANIKAHIDAGGQTFSIWRVVWIGLVGVVVLMIGILVIVIFIN